MAENQAHGLDAARPHRNWFAANRLKLLLSLAALTVLALHLFSPVVVDAIGLGLLALAILPWLSDVLETAELPGGWTLKFRQVDAEQRRLGAEVRQLQFLMRNFLTRFELRHLEKLAADGPFLIDFDAESKPYFERELYRMLDLNLIQRVPPHGVRSLLHRSDGMRQVDGKRMKDVKEHLRITADGIDYLRMRLEIKEEE